jgi:hypothetical protein
MNVKEKNFSNASPKQSDLSILEGINLPVVVSFYAGDDYYYQAAKLLRADCERLGLEHSIDEIIVPPSFDWAQICRVKATFYRKKLVELNRPILWIDVDSRLRFLPEALIGARYDFAAFLRGFSELDPYRLVQFARQWYPGILFINNNQSGLDFANTLAELADSYPGKATDDFFLEEAWQRHRSTLTALPIPPLFLDRDGSEPFRAISFGNSGNVKEFKDKVDQHSNGKMANLKLMVLAESAVNAPTIALKRSLLRQGWSRDVNDLNLMLKTAQSLLTTDSGLATEILQRAAYLEPRKYESRRILTDLYIMKGDFRRAQTFAEEMLNSEYDDWRNVGKARLTDIALEVRAAAAGLSKAERIPLWWAKGPNQGNFGDILNPYLVEKISGNVPRFDQRGTGMLAIGSVIKFAKKNTWVWGTGCSRRSDFVVPDARYQAVRGPITREIIRKSGGYCDTIYGDPALLLPEIYNPKIRKEHRLGYIPHYIHQNEELQTDAHTIDILRSSYEDIEAFVRELNSCEAVICTSLHAIIVANAYGIPARWATFQSSENKVAGDDMKFEDYFLSVGMPVQKPFDLSETRVLDSKRILQQMDKSVDLKINLNALREAFPLEVIPKKESSIEIST